MMNLFKAFLLGLGLVLLYYPTLAQSTQIQYLSGTGSDATVDWEFFCTDGRNSNTWTTIPVPSCWELQGFGEYNYGHVPFEERLKEQGLYKHRFAVPEEWRDQVVYLVFEGVMTDAEVKVNGESAGPIHQGAFYEFKYDITPLLQFGVENLLEVTVRKFSENTSVNYAERKADFWIFGGIFRPVYLEVKPQNHIERVAILAEADGRFLSDVFYQGTASQAIRTQFYDQTGQMVHELTMAATPDTTRMVRMGFPVPNVVAWNPEMPTLYTVVFSLLADDQQVLHEHRETIGFRTVEVREKDGIYLNGQRIKFKGINRHSFWPTSGRTLNASLSVQDVRLIKEMNMNALRMSHYPPDKHLLDACDSLGLLVINELCTWQAPALDTAIGRKLVKELVVRDVNHPSIILWSNGNEGGFNYGLDDDYAVWDIQAREVIHPWETFRKTNTTHYIRYQDLDQKNDDKGAIFFPTEVLHGLDDGGHGAGLDDFWQRMWHDPLSAGGFLWVFADEAVVRTDHDNALDTDGNHAPDGVVGPYREKEGSFFTIKEIWSPIQIEERYITPKFNGKFRIENRYYFTNLQECRMDAYWVKLDQADTLSSNTLELPALAPGETGWFTLDLPTTWQEADVLYLRAIDPHGQEIFTWSYPVKTPAEFNQNIRQSSTATTAINAQETAEQVTLSNGALTVVIDKTNGQLQRVSKAGQIIPLDKGPLPVNGAFKPTVFKHGQEGRNYVVESRTEDGQQGIKWTLTPDGLLHLTFEIFRKRGISATYEGISFSYPEANIKGMSWVGEGPYRVWKNRMKGTRFGLWQNDYNNTITGFAGSDYDYPEFKGFFADLYRATIETRDGLDFTVYCHTPNIFLRMLTPETRTDAPREQLDINYPPGDLSFLHTIAPIGTKFKHPEQLGPQSQPETRYQYHNSDIKIELTFEF